MKFSWFLALRYLKPKRTFISIITVISIAGVALGVGVLLVVIAVMSGFEKRIKDEWLKVEPPLFLIDDTRSWVTTEDESTEPAVPLWREMIPKLKSVQGVANASPFIRVPSLIQQARAKELDNGDLSVPPPGPDLPDAPAPEPPGGGKGAPVEPSAAGTPSTEPVPPAAPPEPKKKESVTGLDRTLPPAQGYILGVNTEDPAEMARLERRFDELRRRRNSSGEAKPQAWGEFDLSGETIVCSHDLALTFSRGSKAGPVTVGETRVNIFGPKYLNEGIAISEENRQAKGDKAMQEEFDAKDREYPLPAELTIAGIFNDDKQQGIAYVSLTTAQNLAGAGKAVDGIAIDLADAYDAPAMAKKLEEAGLVPPGWRTETWIERHRQQFEAVANERGMMYVVLLFISVVAAFCIMNTMITMAVQKRREIGMMRALGAKTSHIVSLFMTKGFIIGVFGVGVGYALGRVVLFFRNDLRTYLNDHFGHQIFDSSIYGLSEIPAELRTIDEVIICGAAFLLCTLAAVPPAFLVGRMEPARALRNAS